MRVIKDGKEVGGRVPAGHLATIIESEAFLQCFLPVDTVTTTPVYLPGYVLVSSGHNAGTRYRFAVVNHSEIPEDDAVETTVPDDATGVRGGGES